MLSRLGGRRQRISTDSAGTGRAVASLLAEAQIYSAACQLRNPLFRKWVRSALLLLTLLVVLLSAGSTPSSWEHLNSLWTVVS